MLMLIYDPTFTQGGESGVNILKQVEKPAEKRSKTYDYERWNEGLENHERLKKLLPFLNEDEGYL